MIELRDKHVILRALEREKEGRGLCRGKVLYGIASGSISASSP